MVQHRQDASRRLFDLAEQQATSAPSKPVADLRKYARGDHPELIVV